MQRELRFRAWLKKEGRLSGDRKSEGQMTDDFGFTEFDGDYFIPLGCYLEDMEVMQFTGLRDKNGKEIYEGDILASSGKGSISKKLRAKVTWETPTPFAGYYLLDNEKNGEYCLTKYNADYWVVIGNVYENPELLK